MSRADSIRQTASIARWVSETATGTNQAVSRGPPQYRHPFQPVKNPTNIGARASSGSVRPLLSSTSRSTA